jgi:Galactose oxidase, central domain
MRRTTGTTERGRTWSNALALGAIAIVAVELVSLLPGGFGSAPARLDSSGGAVALPPPGRGGTGPAALAAAEKSLYDGAGPAAGESWSCREATDPGRGASCGSDGVVPATHPLITTSPSWTQLLYPVPGVRYLQSMAYDVQDGYVVLFGGRFVGALGDTWTFSNGLWTHLVLATHPSPRSGAGMAFDAIDHYVVLYGGSTGTSLPTDTWKFAAGAWTLLAPTRNPGSLFYPSMSYDGKDHYIVLFGGEDLSLVAHGATWKFVGGQWTQLAPATAPSARFATSLAYDAKDGYLVLFGGTNGTATFADTWNFSATRWTHLTPSTHPSARSGEAMAYSPKDGKLLLFGGFSGTALLSDSWTFGGGLWTKIGSVAHPSSRADVGIADGTFTSNVALFGGDSVSAVSNDTWSFHGIIWAHVAPRTPTTRSYATMTYDEADGYVLLFGGLTSITLSDFADTWTYSHGIWTPLHPAASPPARDGAAMAYDAADGYVLLFGGENYSPGTLLSDTWSFVGGVWTSQSSVTAPNARFASRMTYDFADGYVLLFGGLNATLGYLSDTWTYSGGAWLIVTTGTSPSPRDGVALTYDSADGYVLLFSGFEPNVGTYPDTWTYLAGTWSNITGSLSVSPVGLTGAGMVDDTYQGYVVLYGGYSTSAGFSLGTWSFAGGTWTLLSPAKNPGADSGFGFAFDPNVNKVVLNGGLSSTGTWAY